MKIDCAQPWLCADLEAEHEILSWCPYRPGFQRAQRILWREVRNADLTADFDVERWLEGELRSKNALDTVCFLTSRDVRRHHYRHVTIEDASVEVLATVGLGNAEAVGRRLNPYRGPGTINIAAQVHGALSEAARIEALSIIASARTAAIMDAGIDLPTGRATGTGTDCIALATRTDAQSFAFAGMHTALGEALGRAVREAVHEGALTAQDNLHVQIEQRTHHRS